MSEAAISLRGVVKSFGGRRVLDGVDFEVGRGEIVGFVGPNGAGKTTCLRLLIGLTHRDGGEARVLGFDPSTDSVAVRRRCCYLPGETSLYQNVTGAELLRFAHAGYARRDDELAAAMLDRFALPLERRVREYSAGMKQKLALLIALVPDVDLYLLDEPDRNLDPSTQVWMLDLIARFRARGKTVVFCSHRLGEVEVISERLLFLLDGRILDEAHLRDARGALRREVRIRLAEGATLPDGAELVGRDPDGCMRVRPLGDPLAWIARLDLHTVLSIELGPTHLDHVYRAVTERAGRQG